MNRKERRIVAKQLKVETKDYSDQLEMVPIKHWPPIKPKERIFAVFRSKKYLVQLYHEKEGIIRLSVCRTEVNNKLQWKDNITWDELQKIKKECGFAQCDAVEIYPAEKDLVNVANMRHLWVLSTPIMFAWRN
jgi:hypothetical protein